LSGVADSLSDGGTFKQVCSQSGTAKSKEAVVVGARTFIGSGFKKGVERK
jgi:hypothetical protein